MCSFIKNNNANWTVMGLENGSFSPIILYIA